IRDSNCGIKVLKREAADPTGLFNYGLPMIVPLLRVRGFKAMELPVSLGERKVGESKYFENGHLLGGSKNIGDILFHSVMLVNLFVHVPLEWRSRISGKTRNLMS